jgi:DHA1 family tetracycline resistance protein-like MFS transporter
MAKDPPPPPVDEPKAPPLQGYLLAVSSGLRFAAEVAIRQTGAQLWLNHFQNDTVAMALAFGKLKPTMNLVSFFVTPLVGGLSDSIGRRPVMALSVLFQQAAFFSVLMMGEGMLSLYAMEFFMVLQYTSGGLSNRAALGDLFGRDPARYASFVAIKELMTPVMKMIIPMIAGLLARRSSRLPFQLAVGISAANGLLVLSIPEPLPAAKRQPFSLGKSLNPFGCLELFRRGRPMAVSATMAMIDSVSESCAGPSPAEQLCELHRINVNGWDAFQRGRWESINSLFRTLGFVFTSGAFALPKLLGLTRALDVSLVCYIAQALWLALASSEWQFYATLPLYSLKLLRDSVQKTTVQQAGQRAGFGNGELSALLYNLNTIMEVLSPPPWSWVYAAGVNRGGPGLFYVVIAGMTAVKLALVHAVGQV